MSKKKSSMKNRWTQAQDNKIIEMKIAGKRDKDIARILKRTPASVSVRCTWLRQNGMLPRVTPNKVSKNKATSKPKPTAETTASIANALATELNDAIVRLLTYVSMLEKQNAQLTKTLNEVRSAVEK